MNQSRLDELIDRLTSRKLWLTLLSIAFAAWNYYDGRLSAVEFQAAIFGAVTAFSIAEGAADAVAAYKPKPAGPEQTVEVNTQPPADEPVSVRVRPSRAKETK